MRIRNDTILNNITHISIARNEFAREQLLKFKKISRGQNELTRINLARQLCIEWKKAAIPFHPPACPERNDFWYLVQLYSLDRHVHKNKKPYFFNLDRDEELFIENESYYAGNIYYKNKSLLINLLIEIARQKNLKLTSLPYPSREMADFLVENCSDEALQELKFSTKKWKITFFPYDIYIRAAKKLKILNNKFNIYFDGYRMRSDGELRSLFGGTKIFGGPSFIDSMWDDIINTSVLPKLVIIRKDYGC